MTENSENPHQVAAAVDEVETNIYCSSCEEKLQEELAFRCRDCETNERAVSGSNLQICDTCIGWHVKKMHAVIDYRGHDSEICSQHKIICSHFCVDCESLLCLKCTLDHGGHHLKTIQSVASEARKQVFQLMDQFEEREKVFQHKKDELDQSHKILHEELILTKEYLDRKTKTAADLLLKKCRLVNFESAEAGKMLEDSLTLKRSDYNEIDAESVLNERELLCSLQNSDASLVTKIKRMQTNCNGTLKKRASFTENSFYVEPFSYDEAKIDELVGKFVDDVVVCLKLPMFKQVEIQKCSEESFKMSDEFWEQKFLNRFPENSDIFDFEQTEDELQITCWENDKVIDEWISREKDDCNFKDKYIINVKLSGDVHFIQRAIYSDLVFIITNESVFEYTLKSSENPVLITEYNWNDFECPLAIHPDVGIMYWDKAFDAIKASKEESVKIHCSVKPCFFSHHSCNSDRVVFQLINFDIIYFDPEQLTSFFIPYSLHNFPQIDWIKAIYPAEAEKNTLILIWCCKLKQIKVFFKNEAEENFSLKEVHQWEGDNAASIIRIESNWDALDSWFLHLKFKKGSLEADKNKVTEKLNEGFIVF